MVKPYRITFDYELQEEGASARNYVCQWGAFCHFHFIGCDQLNDECGNAFRRTLSVCYTNTVYYIDALPQFPSNFMCNCAKVSCDGFLWPTGRWSGRCSCPFSLCAQSVLYVNVKRHRLHSAQTWKLIGTECNVRRVHGFDSIRKFETTFVDTIAFGIWQSHWWFFGLARNVHITPFAKSF